VKVEVSHPKLHKCRGNKFVDYEVCIEVGFGDRKILHSFLILCFKALNSCGRSGRSLKYVLLAAFFSNRPAIKLSSGSTPL